MVLSDLELRRALGMGWEWKEGLGVWIMVFVYRALAMNIEVFAAVVDDDRIRCAA